jgi:hypothetical protein
VGYGFWLSSIPPTGAVPRRLGRRSQVNRESARGRAAINQCERSTNVAADTLLVVTNTYDNVDDAIADYEAAQALWREGVSDTYDAAVVTHRETAKSRS